MREIKFITKPSGMCLTPSVCTVVALATSTRAFAWSPSEEAGPAEPARRLSSTTEDEVADRPSVSPSLNGRHFCSVAEVAGGDVGSETIFEYREVSEIIEASYSGGSIVRGFLIGTRTGDELDFRYVQLRTDGTTATGHCRSHIEQIPEGGLRLHETWHWESSAGSGTSILEEIPVPNSEA